MADLVASVTARHQIDILVNVAGIQRRESAEEYSQQALNEVLQVNTIATFTLCRDMGKYWIANGMRGKIINTASLATFIGSVKIVGYAMSKAAIGQMTKALSNEWASAGINVNAIAPGYVPIVLALPRRRECSDTTTQIRGNGYEYRHKVWRSSVSPKSQ